MPSAGEHTTVGVDVVVFAEAHFQIVEDWRCNGPVTQTVAHACDWVRGHGLAGCGDTLERKGRALRIVARPRAMAF